MSGDADGEAHLPGSPRGIDIFRRSPPYSGQKGNVRAIVAVIEFLGNCEVRWFIVALKWSCPKGVVCVQTPDHLETHEVQGDSGKRYSQQIETLQFQGGANL